MRDINWGTIVENGTKVEDCTKLKEWSFGQIDYKYTK